MANDTVGKAWEVGWRGHMRCAQVQGNGKHIPHECGFRINLDMDTLAVAKGPSIALAKLPSRLIYPLCRSSCSARRARA